MKKIISFFLSTSLAVSVAAMRGDTEHPAPAAPIAPAAAQPPVALGPPIPAPRMPTREECASYLVPSPPPPLASRQDQDFRNLRRLLPGYQAGPFVTAFLPPAATPSPVPSASPSPSPTVSGTDASRPASQESANASFYDLFPKKVFRLVSAGYDIGNKNWVRFGFRFDGVRRTFTLETCAKDPVKQYPQLWRTLTTALSDLTDLSDANVLHSRLPIVWAPSDSNAWFDVNYSFTILFETPALVNRTIQKMTLQHWDTAAKNVDDATATTEIPVWNAETEASGTGQGEMWPCDWQFI